MTDQPRGPNVRKLVDTMEAGAAQIDPTRAASRLRHLGAALMEAGNKLRSGDPEAFSHVTPEDMKTLVTLVEALHMSSELIRAARELDAEGN